MHLSEFEMFDVEREMKRQMLGIGPGVVRALADRRMCFEHVRVFPP
jgi:hypothetical protein